MSEFVTRTTSSIEAFRHGGGVPYGAYGAEFREGQARLNRAMFLNQLGQQWLPAVPDVHARLQAAPPARVADVGCGAGWSCPAGRLMLPPVKRVARLALIRAPMRLNTAAMSSATAANTERSMTPKAPAISRRRCQEPR